MFEEAANVAIFSFVEHNFEPGVTPSLSQNPCLLHTEKITGGGANTTAESVEQDFVGDRADLHVIGFVKVRLRRGNARGPLGVIGEQQQPFAGSVEPSYRRNPR